MLSLFYIMSWLGPYFIQPNMMHRPDHLHETPRPEYNACKVY